jgi:hypothetical protein
MSNPSALNVIVKVAEQRGGFSIVDGCELIVWRELQPRLDQAVTSLLAAYGDHAPKDLIELQHTLAELGRSPFGAKQSVAAKEKC